MIKQTLFFSTPAVLSLRNAQLVISWKDKPETLTRPVEDIGCIVLENQEIRVTLPLLNQLVQNNVAVIFCDSRAMPSALLQPLESNATQAESLKQQLSASEPLKKQAWKQIVEAKIRNQAALLSKFGKDGDALKSFSENVRSGDADNREGAAAKIYWTLLFGANFKRDRYGPAPNTLLNYGYAILRASAARALMGSGLLPAVGLFHKSRYNAFPLADDIMEPFRPYVDEIVLNLLAEFKTELTKDAKAELLRINACDVMMNKVRRPLQIALTFTSASLAKYLAGKTKKLSLPIFQ